MGDAVTDGGWCSDAVGYEVYLRSFADSDGDGIGDLAGLTAHLDHLADLGVDLVWVTPFYPSPIADPGEEGTVLGMPSTAGLVFANGHVNLDGDRLRLAPDAVAVVDRADARLAG